MIRHPFTLYNGHALRVGADSLHGLAELILSEVEAANFAVVIVMQHETCPTTGNKHIQGFYKAARPLDVFTQIGLPFTQMAKTEVACFLYCVKEPFSNFRYVATSQAQASHEWLDAILDAVRPPRLIRMSQRSVRLNTLFYYEQEPETANADSSEASSVAPGFDGTESLSESADESFPSELSSEDDSEYRLSRIPWTEENQENATLPKKSDAPSKAWWLVVEPKQRSLDDWRRNPDHHIFELWIVKQREDANGIAEEGLYHIWILTTSKQRLSSRMLAFVLTDEDIREAYAVDVARVKAHANSDAAKQVSLQRQILTFIQERAQSGNPATLADVLLQFPEALNMASALKIAKEELNAQFHREAPTSGRLAAIRWIHGKPGTGKTRAALDLAKAFCAKYGYDPERQIAVVTAGDPRYHDGINGGPADRRTRVLVLDEVTKPKFANNFNTHTPHSIMSLMTTGSLLLNKKMRPNTEGYKIDLDALIVTSNCAPEDCFSEMQGDTTYSALMSRLQAPGCILHFAGQDLRSLAGVAVHHPMPFAFDPSTRTWFDTDRPQPPAE